MRNLLLLIGLEQFFQLSEDAFLLLLCADVFLGGDRYRGNVFSWRLYNYRFCVHTYILHYEHAVM